MAKKSNTQDDPATLAFSAVEDALKDSVFGGPASADTGTQPEPLIAPSRQQQTSGRSSDRARVADKQASMAGSVANDDRFQGSRILYGLQSRSSSTPNLVAILVAVAWVVAIVAVALIRNGRDFGTPAFFGSNDFIGLVALAVIPVLGFFAIATLIRRAQDLRNAATAVTHAAIRLAEPETTASEKVASVGQAVRREVNALGDGLERALSRAGELEVMIHNEVTALERTYSDNESRMRALIQELASQREAVITNTERVREAITESHTGLVFDLDMISQRIAGTIVESGGNLTKALETAGNSLNGAFGERTESFVSLIDQRTSHLLSALDDSASRLNITLEDRAGSISQAFENRTMELSQVIDARTNGLTEALDNRATTLAEAIENRTSSLAKLLSQGGITLLDQLRDRGHEVSSALDMIGSRISADIQQRSREAEALMGNLTKQLDEQLSIQINSMESKLQTSMIELAGALDDTTERARVTLMGAGSQNLTQFDARLDEIAVVIDTRLQSLDGVVGDKGDKLIAALEKHNASFAARANVLEMALDEKSGHFNDIVNQRTREMIETLGQRSKQITEVIGNRSREISDALEGHSQILADALDSRTQILTDSLQARTSDLVDALQSRTGEMSDTLLSRAQEINELLAGRTTLLDNALNTHVSNIGSVMETRFASVDQTLQQHTDALSAALDQRTQLLASTVGTRSSELSEALNARTQQLAEVLGTHTAAIAGAIGDRTMELARTIDAQGTQARDKIDASLRSVTDVMADRATAVTALIASKVGEVNDNLGRGIDSAILRIADAESGVTARIDGAAATVGESARKAADIIETGVNSARKAITDMVDQRLGTLPEAITARADITAERLASLNTAINTALVQSMADLEAGADRIEETISKRIVAATANITLDVAETADRMDTHVRQAMEQIHSASRSIDELISIKAVAATEAIEGRVTALNQSVMQQTNDLAGLIARQGEQFHAVVAGQSDSITSLVTQQAQNLATVVAQQSDNINAVVTQQTQGLSSAVAQQSENLSAVIAQQTQGFNAVVEQQTQSVNATVAEHSAALSAVVARETQTLGSVVTSETQSLGEVIARETQNLGATVAQQAEAISNVVTEQSGSITALVGQHADTLASTVADRASALESALRTHGNILNEALAAAASQTEQMMHTTSERIQSDAIEAFTRLNRANEILQQVLEGANRNLTELETNVANQTATYSSTVRDAVASTEQAGTMVSEQVNGLQSTVRAMMDEFASLLGNINSEVAAIDQAAASLNQAGTQSLTQLEERRTAMDALSQSFTTRADEIDERMRGFAQSIADTINATERRLLDARAQMESILAGSGDQVNSALSTATSELTSRLGDFREAAGAETEKASDVLRQTQATMILEMQQALEEATRRFTETATAMRATAKEVGTELEATRSELARGVMELPEETKTSAAAMRRVVAEQIEALSELNAIVRAQSATHDLTERRSAPRQEPRPEPVRAAEPPRPAPAPITPPPAPRTVTVAEAPAPRPAPVAEAPKPAPARTADDASGGWLRDVLRNANSPAAPAAAPQQNLTALTDEIARSIDPTALGDAWTRYQMGEQNVFSRRIYTLTGQSTFDQVKRRLTADAEFAKNAQSYMSEFEQLLQRAASGSDPVNETRAYLTSDRGKVYTMLAHASGRLG